MKLQTEIARELFLYGPKGGKRITSVNELAAESGASKRAIENHMPGWKRESEELAASCGESGFVLALSSKALAAHKSDCDFLRAEVDRLKGHLRTLSPADETYCPISRAMLATERQWATMSGVHAALEAAGARLKDKERLEAKKDAARASLPAPRPAIRQLAGFARRGDYSAGGEQ